MTEERSELSLAFARVLFVIVSTRGRFAPRVVRFGGFTTGLWRATCPKSTTQRIFAREQLTSAV